ncbi:MAG TPA: pyridoxamine 5'-phosphate oxidase family protein [Actinospica sp.]|jgi:nitroimidazol reductase NimA-like FMN-containing flavoprotein (pyridoxamine 5'-phosphate oxidase superfamily)|nr:pyridoxamine 5'-phosphate oxidase family protein [Actinospica sp.]
MDSTRAGTLATLHLADCLALLTSQEVGRLVYTKHALPAITPVNYVLREDGIWIWTASSSSMWQAVRGAVVAFEVDEMDRATRTGWSVVVLGVVELVRDPKVVEAARALGLEPWVMGRKEHLLRIPLTVVTGRRTGYAADG